jgi:RNA polymerase sigma-70 factor (ECF subfamily)
VALSEIDRHLLERCLARAPRAWEDFVDRFMGLVIHVVNHTAQSRSIRLTQEDKDDLAGEVFLTVVKNDFAALRHFRGQSSLATYLTVIARRVVVHQLLDHKKAPAALGATETLAAAAQGDGAAERLGDREEIDRLLHALEGTEAEIVRLYHLEGKSYRQISTAVGMPENSIGPTLSRARAKMREAGNV